MIDHAPYTRAVRDQRHELTRQVERSRSPWRDVAHLVIVVSLVAVALLAVGYAAAHVGAAIGGGR